MHYVLTIYEQNKNNFIGDLSMILILQIFFSHTMIYDRTCEKNPLHFCGSLVYCLKQKPIKFGSVCNSYTVCLTSIYMAVHYYSNCKMSKRACTMYCEIVYRYTSYSLFNLSIAVMCL